MDSRDIQVWKCGRRRTDDGPLVYYKLTLWAFGSGELKKQTVASEYEGTVSSGLSLIANGNKLDPLMTAKPDSHNY